MPPGISSDNSFDQAVRVNVGGDVALTDEMRERHPPADFGGAHLDLYMGFNMLDRWSAGRRSGRPSCARRSRSPSTRRVHLHLPERALPRRPIAAGHRLLSPAVAGSIPMVYDWVDGKASASRCAGQATDGRGRLSERAP